MDTTTAKSVETGTLVTTAGPELAMKTGNKFVFNDPASKTNITYYPCAFGPPVAGQKSGPELEYAGEEGKFVFRADEITEQDNRFGKLLSVQLPQIFHVGMRPLMIAVCLPVVNIGTDSISQTFNTFGVKCHGPREGYVSGPGATMTYNLMHLEGTAMWEYMPMVAKN